MRFIFCCFLLLIGVSGCVSKAKSDLRAREAFLAGEQQIIASEKSQDKVVIVRGDVKNETVPWTEGMTVAKAIVAAQYQGLIDPKRIIIVHNNQHTEMKATDLFHGDDPTLDPGDMVVLRKQ